jgi:hypothetical protein
MTNQNPEQTTHVHIDRQLIACGWLVQDKNRINLRTGVAVLSIPNLGDWHECRGVVYLGRH